MQDNLPVAYASRSMSETEQRYAQIEKQLLAIIYSCKKFHNNIYGRKIIVKSDHQPLLSILEKDIHKISSGKLQRMRIRLLNYDIKIEYLPGKYMYIADYLSRDSIQEKSVEEEKVFHEFILSINVSSEREEKFKSETKKDPILGRLILNYRQGWPGHKSKVHESIRFFFNKRNDIMEHNEILLYEDRIMVPESMQNEMLLHESHLGKTKGKDNILLATDE